MANELEDVSGIGKATAERLKAAGIDSVQKLATVKLEDLLRLKIKGTAPTIYNQKLYCFKIKFLKINKIRQHIEEIIHHLNKNTL